MAVAWEKLRKSGSLQFLQVASFSYILAVIYGTLYPLTGWEWNTAHIEKFFSSLWPKYITRSDTLTNIFVYIPLGLLVGSALLRYYRFRAAFVLTLIIGTAISFCLEFTQIFLPQRIASLLDVYLNALGSALGALLAGAISKQTRVGDRLHHLGYTIFRPGISTEIGLVILSMWAVSQLVPFELSWTEKNIAHGIAPLWDSVVHGYNFRLLEMLGFAASVAALGYLFNSLAQPHRRDSILYGLFVLCVLLLQIPIVDRQLTLESIIGMLVGILLFISVRSRQLGKQMFIAGVFSVGVVLMEKLQPDYGHITHPINWIPFRDQMHRLLGFADIISNVWPFAALAYFNILYQTHNTFRTVIIGCITIFVGAFCLEFIQQYIPGRYPDITDAILAAIGWLLPWLFMLFKPPALHSRTIFR